MRQTCPSLWLISDQRNDALLEAVLRRLPRGSGFVFRHYHLPPAERIARFMALRRVCRARGHLLILADSTAAAKEWGADGIYGAPRALAPRRIGLFTLATVHDLGELAEANKARADAAMLSPVFATRSHPKARTLGPIGLRLLAKFAHMPVIALGGMDAVKARRARWKRWAAIDGLSPGCRDS